MIDWQYDIGSYVLHKFYLLKIKSRNWFYGKELVKLGFLI